MKPITAGDQDIKMYFVPLYLSSLPTLHTHRLALRAEPTRLGRGVIGNSNVTS